MPKVTLSGLYAAKRKKVVFLGQDAIKTTNSSGEEVEAGKDGEVHQS